MRNLKRNVKALRAIGFGIDIANVVLGVVVLVLSIFILINVGKFVKMFPFIFLAAFVMNFLMAVKNSFREETAKARFKYIISGLLLFISISGFIGLWR